MYSKHDCARGSIANVNAPLTWDALKTQLNNDFVEGFVPMATGLAHAINAFYQLHNPGFFAQGFEAGRLFHVGCLALR